jgi:hypothetical protein
MEFHEFRVPMWNFSNKQFLGFAHSYLSHGNYSFDQSPRSNGIIYGNDEQYIHVNDMNNKHIFEGDIVKVKSLSKTELTNVGSVFVDEVDFCDGHFYVKGYASMLPWCRMEIEVIGNIHATLGNVFYYHNDVDKTENGWYFNTEDEDRIGSFSSVEEANEAYLNYISCLDEGLTL